MKKLIIAGLCFAGCLTQGFGQGALLNAGAEYSYEFTNFVFQAGDNLGPYAEVGLTFSSLTPADSFEFTAFENAFAQVPLLTTNVSSSSGLPVFALGPAWQDFQGLIRIRMVSGSMTLLDFYGTMVTAEGAYYSEKPPVVPEPSTMIVLAGGLVTLGLIRARSRRVRPD
jgi:hypothetical protein